MRVVTPAKISRKYDVQWSGLLCLTDRAAQSGGCWDDDKQNAALKLLCKQIGKAPTFGIDTDGYQCLNTLFMVNLEDTGYVYYMLGILNSDIIKYYWMKKFYDHRTTFPKIKGTYLKLLPIKKFEKANSNAVKIEQKARFISDNIAALANLKLESDRRLLQQKLSHAEREINEAVYNLYGLDSDQVALIRAFLAA
jgi:hypothetical protein